MEIYFFDENNRYIGHRTLNDGEVIPTNATTKPVILGDGQEAFLLNNEWVVSDIKEVIE